MGILAGQTVNKQFTTRDPDTGLEQDASSTPTAVLVRNGADTGVDLTVTNVKTGVYLVSTVIPESWDPHDVLSIRVRATVAGVTDNFHVWDEAVDDPALITDIAYVLSSVRDLNTNISRLLSRLSAKTSQGGGQQSSIIGGSSETLLPLETSVQIIYPGTVYHSQLGTIVGYAGDSEYLVRLNSGQTTGIPINRVLVK